jgi:DNA mismatch repair protein MutL
MNIINKLDNKLINQIAAGEVVDNPASIIKELIENSIDAKSKNISISIFNGGSKEITIIDDGIGMSSDDIQMAFKRFATSKISSQEDLYKINTLGFRGEALPSIASVSQVTATSSHNSESNQIIINGGEFISIKPSSHSEGTKIIIRNLFYNVPARKKFLKKESYEYTKILKIFKIYALSNSDISFKLYNNNKLIYNLHKTNSYDRIIELNNHSFKGNLLEIDFKFESFSIKGYIGNLSILRKRRGNQFIFVNDRFIQNRLIDITIMNSYQYLIDRGEYPFYFLKIQVPVNTIDVNVHPKKTEIKFDNELHIQHIIKRAIVNKLKDFKNVIPDMYIKSEDYENSIIDLPLNFNSNDKNELNDKVDSMFSQNDDYITSNVKVWQIHNKYLLTEISSGLVIIDQHVAHERILYEAAKISLESGGIESQKIMFPIAFDFSPDDYNAVIEIIPYLTKIGFDIRAFGENSIVVEGTPPELNIGREKEVINEILDNYIENKQLNSSFVDYMAATYACKAAVKAGDKLDDDECISLVDKLFSTKHPYYCPHGRPIIINLSMNDLDKRFERI